jgi:hypothetical protein
VSAGKHTQGPWIAGTSDNGNNLIVANNGATFIAEARYSRRYPSSIQEHNANARLIASAPELLAALQQAEKCLRWAAQESAGRVKQEIVGGWIHHADQAIAAIARATNQTDAKETTS